MQGVDEIDMWEIKRKNKKYDKRYLMIYYNNKLINYVYPFYSWYSSLTSFSNETMRLSCRMKILENLYWLVGKDCDYETWIKCIEKLDRGHVEGGVGGQLIPQSVFYNEDEKLVAIKSFNN